MNIEEIKSVLKKKTVGIAGAGGLGSNCAASLTRVGIGKLVIADYDCVDESNLNRQFYFYHQIGKKKVEALIENLLLINPELLVEAHDVVLEPDNIIPIFKDCDVIVEAFDKADQKKMLIECVTEYLPMLPVIIGLGMAGYGNSNNLKMEKYGKLYICGDRQSEITEFYPPLSPRVGIVAHIQANTVLEILLNPTN